MRMQSTRAAAGSRSMTVRLVLPLSNGTSQAPTIRMRPGCTHSGVIVVFRTRQPQLAQELRHHDDRYAGDQTVERAPGWNVLEPEVGVIGSEETRHGDLSECECRQRPVEPA